MKVCLPIGGTRRYRDDRTGREYRFDHMRFHDAYHDAVNREDNSRKEDTISKKDRIMINAENRKKVEVRLARAACVSEAAVYHHIRSSGGPPGENYPADISVIRSYGLELAGDEDAFLRPLILPERLSQTPPEEFKRRGEREWADLEKCIYLYSDDKEGEMQVIREVFAALWELLSLYDISDGYNRRPDTGDLEGAEKYFDGLLEVPREILRSIDPSLLKNHYSYPLGYLGRILEETGHLLKSYSLPGTASRWRELNPRLDYYDPIFALLENAPAGDRERIRLRDSVWPTQRDIQMRQLYFSGIEGPWENVARAYFQEELLDTLVKVFDCYIVQQALFDEYY